MSSRTSRGSGNTTRRPGGDDDDRQARTTRPAAGPRRKTVDQEEDSEYEGQPDTQYSSGRASGTVNVKSSYTSDPGRSTGAYAQRDTDDGYDNANDGSSRLTATREAVGRGANLPSSLGGAAVRLSTTRPTQPDSRQPTVPDSNATGYGYHDQTRGYVGSGQQDPRERDRNTRDEPLTHGRPSEDNRQPASGNRDDRSKTIILVQRLAPMIKAFVDTPPTNYQEMAAVLKPYVKDLDPSLESVFEDNAMTQLKKSERLKAMRYVQLAQFIHWHFNLNYDLIGKLAKRDPAVSLDALRLHVLNRDARLKHALEDTRRGSNTGHESIAQRDRGARRVEMSTRSIDSEAHGRNERTRTVANNSRTDRESRVPASGRERASAETLGDGSRTATAARPDTRSAVPGSRAIRNAHREGPLQGSRRVVQQEPDISDYSENDIPEGDYDPYVSDAYTDDDQRRVRSTESVRTAPLDPATRRQVQESRNALRETQNPPNRRTNATKPNTYASTQQARKLSSDPRAPTPPVQEDDYDYPDQFDAQEASTSRRQRRDERGSIENEDMPGATDRQFSHVTKARSGQVSDVAHTAHTPRTTRVDSPTHGQSRNLPIRPPLPSNTNSRPAVSAAPVRGRR